MDLKMIIFQLIFSYLATVGFAVTLNIPRSALNLCGLIGALGWLVYKSLYLVHTGIVLANLVAALVIGLSSVIAARLKKKPMILFNVPSLVPLVPGGQAYRAIYYFAFKNDNLALRYLVEAGMIAGAISMGFFLAELGAQMYFKLANSTKK
ncbi:threonine/serine exporter family protein [Ligilactobacillus apodemi]|uniref:threonine/serine exporter family protein n=1 Tax=Ligilactobacillus apodemi TaxID=307126 RepID=UPI00214C978D|nr:threonine/serine exporter family protein [Ligilactobacillus apodemi]MCR1901358.1 threonine/serine exporter family protein [Ligilactobacillus apodemi]